MKGGMEMVKIGFIGFGSMVLLIVIKIIEIEVVIFEEFIFYFNLKNEYFN